MNKTLLTATLLASLSLGLSACDKPTVNVGAPAVAVPAPAGPAGATGEKGETGEMGKTGDSTSTTVVVTPATPPKD